MKRVSVVSADITTLQVDAIVNAANRHKNEDDLLGSCYRVSLELAQQHGVRSIAFPAISCGAYRFPIDRAAKVAIATIRDALMSYSELESLLIVAFERQIENAVRRALSAVR